MANNKRFLYVGGLAEEVDVGLLKSTFSAFGDLVDVNIPIDYSANKHRGYAFIEFQWPEDAADAIDNMDNGEILGKTIRVNHARPQKFRESSNNQVEITQKANIESNDDEQIEDIMNDVTETNDPRDQAEPS